MDKRPRVRYRLIFLCIQSINRALSKRKYESVNYSGGRVNFVRVDLLCGDSRGRQVIKRR